MPRSLSSSFGVRAVTRQTFLLLTATGLLAACGKKAEQPLVIRTAEVARRTIVVQAEATGVIEPINVVEVKSRASGQVIQMPVETGTLVREGDLIVQLDTRDVQNQFDQAKADLEAAEKRLEVSSIQKKRSDELLAARIITAQENEAAQLDIANAQSAIVRSRAALDIAQQRLDEARVTAPVLGTIIEKPVALGQVVQSGTSAVGGGTTIVKMADLNRVRARALVNETDIGAVRAGLEATVTVDAFPDRPFRGTVEKIEPQAVVQQNVTMFPVLVTLDNRDGLLMPGMNGEVSIVSERREEVIAVANEAIRSVREAAQAAPLLGLDPDSVQAQIRASSGSGFGGAAGMRNGAPSGAIGSPASPQGGAPAAAPTGGRPSSGATGARANGNRARGTGADSAAPRAGGRRNGGTAEGGTRRGTPASAGGAPNGARRNGGRSALVFVQKADSSWEPRVIRVGVADYDYTEVLSGLQPGEQVALLSAAALQAQRQQSTERFRAMTGGGSPLGGGSTGGGAGGAGGRPTGGAGAGGGGGGGGGRP